MSSLEGKNIQREYKFLSYRVNLYFHDYKLTIEIDENGHRDTNINYEFKIQKAIEQEIGCVFIRIDLDKEDFDIFRATIEIFRNIEQLEFKPDNITKSKSIKLFLEKILPDYKWQWKSIVSVVENLQQTKIQMLEKLNTIDYCSYGIVLFLARKN